MFLREKLKIWFHQTTRLARYHVVYWNAAFFMFVFLTGGSELFENNVELPYKVHYNYHIAIISTWVALLFSALDTMFSDRLMRKSPIRIMLFLRGVYYLLIAYTIIFFAENDIADLKQVTQWADLRKLMPHLTLLDYKFLLFFSVAFVVNYSFKEIYKKIGMSNFRYWMSGRLNKPREERRIFMFIDMRSSTKLAEQLKHKKFSHLVQDVFNDLSVVDNYDGEIYQYLGDGAIVTWSIKQGKRNNNCIKAFFAFVRVVDRRRRYYQRNYGIEPKFKAGLHIGATMVLQVGNVKRDISYNGDVVNTAARIESMCNEHKQNMMISGSLYEALDHDKGEFNFKEVGEIKLKGKSRATQLYGVKLKPQKKK